jgi:hypothetical protein
MIGMILLAALQSVEPATAPAEGAASVPPAFNGAAALPPEALAGQTAREDLSQVIVSRQTARVANNSINGSSVTGGVSFDDNAFSNLQGMAIVGANSGNNVAFNSSLNVNITINSTK